MLSIPAAMRIALIGLPQSGKRTLFTLLTGRTVPESRKPTEVIEGIAAIRDSRIDVLSSVEKPEKTTYAENLFVLCPDVVEGSESRNWLEAAGRCDLICMVLRAFESDQVYHSAGSVDSARDRANIEAELLLADMEIIEKRMAGLAKAKRGSGLTPEQSIEEKTLAKCTEALESNKRISEIGLDATEAASIKSLSLITRLPVLSTFNVSEDDIGMDYGPNTLSISAEIEEEISEIENPQERSEFLQSLGLESSGIDRMNSATYEALGLMSFYTVGPKEVRAWTIRKKTSAPQAAGKVHSDIERGFIRVEIIKYADFVATGSEKAAKEQGKMQLRGKDYVMEDGDICHFLFNV